MQECARWLKTFIAEVPIEFIPTRDPSGRRRSPPINKNRGLHRDFTPTAELIS
jgi:hypothetical protein